MQSIKKKLLASAVLAGLSFSVYAVPSFNCKGALVRAEQIICGSTSLSTLDRQMAYHFKTFNNTHGLNERTREKNIQKKWIIQRNRCGSSYTPIQCMTPLYQNRIRDLKHKNTIVNGSIPSSDLNNANSNNITHPGMDHENNPSMANTGGATLASYRCSRFKTPLHVTFYHHANPAYVLASIGKHTEKLFLSSSQYGSRYTYPIGANYARYEVLEHQGRINIRWNGVTDSCSKF